MSLSEYVAYMDEYVRVFEQNMDGRGDGVGRREHGQRQGENDVEIWLVKGSNVKINAKMNDFYVKKCYFLFLLT